MKYRVEMILTNLEEGQVTKAERSVSVEREKYNGRSMPIDTEQKNSLIKWAINQVADEIIRLRDTRNNKVTERFNHEHDRTAQG